MQRGSDKHGPHVDEALAQETLSLRQGAPVEEHVHEDQEFESAGDEEPTTDERLRGGDPTPEGTLSYDEVELRRRIAASVEGHVFPASKDAILENARGHQAEPRVVRLIEALPDRRFENVQQVWEALGGSTEQRA